MMSTISPPFALRQLARTRWRVSPAPSVLGLSEAWRYMEVTSHLAGLVDAEVEVVLEIRAKFAGGFSDTTIGTVSEHTRAVAFQAFEREVG